MSKRVINLGLLSSVTILCIFLFQNCSNRNFLQSQILNSVNDQTALAFKGRTLYGDLLINNSALINGKSSLNKAIGFSTYSSKPWPNGKIYIDTETYKIPQELVIQIQEACKDWAANSKATCIFVKSNEVENPIYISTHLDGCWTTLGYNNKDVRRAWTTHANHMNMKPSCFDRHSVLHEMGHVFGLIHEHQRYDRDDYIELIQTNIKSDRIFAWSKVGELLDLNNFNKKYDISSIMHYGQYTGDAINSSEPIYKIKSGGVNRGFQLQLSEEDRTAIADIYGYASVQQPVPQQPVVVPQQPVAMPQQPVVVPQQPVAMPQQPVVVNNEVKGYLDRITPDGRVLGWVCNQGIGRSINFHVYGSDSVGGPETFLTGGFANAVSEPQVAAACGVSSGSYRFEIELPAEKSSNKLITVYGISISGDNKNLKINNSGVYRAPIFAQQPVVIQQPVIQQQVVLNNEVKGYLDRITPDGRVQGWVCNQGISKSIDFHVYGSDSAGGPETFLTGGFANAASEPQVVSACGVSSGSYRFEIKLPEAEASNKLITVYGISISGDNKNLKINNSGVYRAPVYYDIRP